MRHCAHAVGAGLAVGYVTGHVQGASGTFVGDPGTLDTTKPCAAADWAMSETDRFVADAYGHQCDAHCLHWQPLAGLIA